MRQVHITYINGPDIEALALTEDEILAAVEAALRAQAAEPFVSSSEEYGRFLRSEQSRWRAVARKANVTLEVQ